MLDPCHRVIPERWSDLSSHESCRYSVILSSISRLPRCHLLQIVMSNGPVAVLLHQHTYSPRMDLNTHRQARQIRQSSIYPGASSVILCISREQITRIN